jgi:hypothetical protein
MKKLTDDQIEQYREMREAGQSITKAMTALGYSASMSRMGHARLPKVLRGVELDISQGESKRLEKLAEEYTPQRFDKLIKGRLVETVTKGADADATPAAKLLGSHKELNLWSPDTVVGVQVNVALLDQLEGVIKTPKD